ncbi:MAG: glycine oxidase ThiO [Panacagrimonas sp.]|jgi:glycine oxidase|nr:FAD-dependent oxidoreductase [Panacagrimonas sp.]MCC2655069.1 glycine oxidase ThiO [Panacagrimonas sp.]
MASSSRSADVLVIGAGVIGLSTALALRRAGLRVCVIERAAVGRGSASWAGGGILSPLEPGGVDDATLPILRDSLARYPAWCEALVAAGAVDPEYRVSGMRVQAPADLAAWTDFFERRCGLRVEIAERDAWLPDVAQVRSPRLLRALSTAFVAGGGEQVEQQAVIGLETTGDRVIGVRTAHGVRSAAVVVLAAGAWSRALSADAPVRPVRGQMLLIDAAPGELDAIVLRDGRYLIPRRDGPVLVGSTLEEAGFGDEVTDEARTSLLASVREMAPRLAQRRVLAHWSGLRPATPAPGTCVVRWAPATRGLFLNTGHHRLGITLAPGSAQRAADAIVSGVERR